MVSVYQLIGCTLPAELLLVLSMLLVLPAQYRELRRHWPHARWVVRLQAAFVGSGGLLVLSDNAFKMVTTIGNATASDSPLFTVNDSHWPAMSAVIYGLGSFTALAFVGMVALIIAQAVRYGLPPRTPRT